MNTIILFLITLSCFLFLFSSSVFFPSSFHFSLPLPPPPPFFLFFFEFHNTSHGEVLFDCIAKPEAAGWELDRVVQDKAWTRYPGGAPANVACALSKLGVSASFVGAVGKDDEGKPFSFCQRKCRVIFSPVPLPAPPLPRDGIVFSSYCPVFPVPQSYQYDAQIFIPFAREAAFRDNIVG